MSWLTRWEPENQQFWEKEGGKIAWTTLTITTFSLIFSFATWFVMSAVAVRLPQIGFKFTPVELFWLAAMPGLAGGTLRIIHTFLIPIFGTRLVISIATWLKIIPCVWLVFAVQDLNTSYGTFMIIALLLGFGGGDFSSYMPSTSLYFPKRLQGTALGIQAGIGNFGVSLTQFVTPWIIGFVLIGAYAVPQKFVKADPIKEVKIVKEVAPDAVPKVKKAAPVKDVQISDAALAANITVTKDPNTGLVTAVDKVVNEATTDIVVKTGKNQAGAVNSVEIKKIVARKDIWLQNSALWYIPILAITGIIAILLLKSVPVKATFAQQLDIFKDKHTWFCTIIYIMTFGSFSGFAAAFPLMIKTIYGVFPGGPEPLKYAFIGPLVGSLIRVIMGWPSDKLGGAIVTTISGIGLIIGCCILLFGGLLTPTGVEQFPAFLWTMLFIFLMSGIGNASTFRQFPIAYAFNPRQGAGVIGFSAAIAAYGPFVFSSMIGTAIDTYGNAKIFFWCAIAFYVIATLINWQYYTKPGAERGDWGTIWGTWWDKAKDTWKQA